MPRDDPAIVVLAAGGSTRLGRPKQSLRLAGQDLLERSLCTALACGVPVALVCQADLRPANLPDGVETIENAHWQRGMGSSIQAAVHTLQDRYRALLFMTVDQPALTTGLLARIIEAYGQGATLVACEYAETVGIPALFGQAYYPELKTIDADRGAKPLLLKHLDECVRIPFADGSLDIDTPADYRAWQERLGRDDPPP